MGDEICMSFRKHMPHCSQQIKDIFPLGIFTKTHKNALRPAFPIQITVLVNFINYRGGKVLWGLTPGSAPRSHI